MSEPKEESKLVRLISEQFSTIITVLFTLQIASFLSTYLFHKSIFIITMLLPLLIIFLFMGGKDFVEEKPKNYGFILVKVSLLFFAFSAVNHFFLMIGAGMRETNIEKADSIFRMSYFINLAVAIGLYGLMRKDETKEFLTKCYEISLLEKWGFKKKSSDVKNGDIILCVNKATNTPEVLPFKDRFLHMLVLGPTGSGKTSQIIIPMINQDMQNFECGITVIEPKADLAEKIYAMAKHYGRKVIYFNPILPECPYFNPLFGKEEDVIENMATTFKMLSPDSPQFFLDMNEGLIRNALKVLKRLLGNDATLIDLHRLISNPQGVGKKMVMSFSRISSETAEIAKENTDISAYFMNDYFNEKSKTYEHCSGIRNQVSKITSNKFLRKVLNPPAGMNDIDFDKHLADGGVIAIATAQGTLRDLGRFLGYFIILQFQASVFRRPGNENTRLAHFLYIDEFQVYANPGFADMLTQGRSYRVASHLATQNRALIGMGRGQEGKDFVELVSTNARNIIIYPGGNSVDAKYYSDQFGEVLMKTQQKGVSQAKFNPLYGFQKIGYANVSVKEVEALEARFTASDLMYRPFGEITYCLIKNNSIQTPEVGTIEYIPRELNQKLDEMIEEYNETIFKKPIRENAVDSGEHGDTANLESIAEPVMLSTPIVKPVVNSKLPYIEDEFKEDKPPKKADDREYISPNVDFTPDIVVETEKSKTNGEVGFMDEDEDDLI